MIILEGLDGTGKSTLSEKLKQFGYSNLYFAHDPENKDIYGKYLNILKGGNLQKLILDRSFISEFVYGNVLRGGSRLSESQIQTLAKNYAQKSGRIIYLVAPYNTLVKRRK